MEPEIIEVGSGLVAGDDVREGVREVMLTLPRPETRLRLRIRERGPGRAEAVFAGRSWAAKHYWEEAEGVWVYEFDEALPAGRITLRVPIKGR